MVKFDLAAYMNDNIQLLIADATRGALKHPRQLAYLVKAAAYARQASTLRQRHEHEGRHIPPFLIASIASSCNLFCKGCYARANQACGSGEQISAARWGELFGQARDMGIFFILLAGGEPFLRIDVIEQAAAFPQIIFPIFTNGTLLDEVTLSLLNKHRNLVPILSIEGNREETDNRRGEGVYNQLMAGMDQLKARGILYGASITVTTQNVLAVSEAAFAETLYQKACRVLFYVEYVPVALQSESLAPTDKERVLLDERQAKLRGLYKNMIIISFPGDEKYTGGCLAAGRGFFHINATGGAEPCPFSPYSDTSLRDCSLFQALQSPLFKKLNSQELLNGDHSGGCVLFDKQAEVEALLND